MNLDELEQRMHEAFRSHTDMDEWRKAEAALTSALRTAARELIADAKRYRWLRSRVPGGTYRIMGVIYGEGGKGVDAAIDAAMQEPPTVAPHTAATQPDTAAD